MKAKLIVGKEDRKGKIFYNISITNRKIPLDQIQHEFLAVVEKFELVALGGGGYMVNVLYADGGGGTEFGGMYVPGSKMGVVKQALADLDYEFQEQKVNK